MPCTGSGNANAVGGSKLAQAEATFKIDAAAATLSPVSQRLQALCFFGLHHMLQRTQIAACKWFESTTKHHCTLRCISLSNITGSPELCPQSHSPKNTDFTCNVRGDPEPLVTYLVW